MYKQWRFLSAALALVLLQVSASAQTGQLLEDNRRLIEYAKQNSELMTNLEYLSDIIGPRLTGSARMKRANEWTAEKMREYGLENVRLEEWQIPAGWERGRLEAHLLEPNGVSISAAAMAWTPGTRGTVVGPVVYFDAKPDNSDLDRFKGKLKNAILLLSPPREVNHHPSRSTGRDVWNRRIGGGGRALYDEHGHLDHDDHHHAEETEAQRRQNAVRDEFFKKEGVAAVLMDSGKPQMLLVMTGSWGREGASSPFPRLFVTNEHYAMLYRLTRRGVPVKMRLRVENRFTRGPVTVYNTVGEIRGSEKPDEMVICGAHLDSWDLATGTVDNGTGSMVVLEAARLIKALGLKPARTIRFVLFSGEEQGLHGSREYVRRHKDEMGKVSAVFVHDTGTGKIEGIGLHGNKQVQPVLEGMPILKELGVTRYSDGLMGGTDHASFYPEGVPAFWFMQDPADYFLSHHTQSDTYDKALKDDLIQGATVMALCAYNVAQLPEMLPRRNTAPAGTTSQRE